jgi:hypothetical protein
MGGHEALIAALRSAFARGESASGEALFADALDAGVTWDVATRAVAEGFEQRFGTQQSRGARGGTLDPT